jgi:hypothetical protein
MSLIDNTHLRILDPAFDKASFRASFKFPSDSVILSDIRLLNVGIDSTQTDDYQATSGASSAIASIRLYDGGTLLDSVENFTLYNNFKNLNNTNDDNLSLNRRLAYTDLGFIQSGVQSASAGVLDKDDYLQVAQSPVADTVGKKAWVSLRECLPFLRSSVIVPTSIYKNLRLEVNYHSPSGLKNFVQKRRDATLSAPQGAIVLFNEVGEGDVKEAMKKQYQGVSFRALEFDRAQVPAVTTAVTDDSTKLVLQQNNFVIHGFNGKRVGRLLMAQTSTDTATWIDGNKNVGYANNTSTAQFRESVNVRVNGVNKLAGDGVGSVSGTGSSKNRRLAMLTDTWGDINLITGQQFCDTQDFNSYIGGADLLRQTQGAVDFMGLVIDDHVKDLQVFYNRHGIHGNPKQVQALNYQLMAEVDKAVVVGTDSSYRVVYA